MASTSDARDILDAKVEAGPRPVKKQKTGPIRPSKLITSFEVCAKANWI
jgi:hypothetical protein